MGRSVACSSAPLSTQRLMPLTPTAYYNAGSAALVLVLIALVVGGFLWWRSKRRAARGLALATHEEHIPLNSALADEDRDFEESLGRELGHTSKVDVVRVRTCLCLGCPCGRTVRFRVWWRW